MIEWLSVKNAATHIDSSERFVRSRLLDPLDPIPHSRIGRMVRIRRSDLDEWMEKHRVSTQVRQKIIHQKSI